jgi:hypothetical protein
MVDEDEELPMAIRGFSWQWRRLSELSVAELRARAIEYRRAAATATTVKVRDSLIRIARRFDARVNAETNNQTPS